MQERRGQPRSSAQPSLEEGGAGIEDMGGKETQQKRSRYPRVEEESAQHPQSLIPDLILGQ